MYKILRILNRLNVGGPTYNVAYLSKHLPNTYRTKVLAGIKESHEASSEYILDELGLNYEFVPNMFRAINPYKDVKALKFIMQQINTWRPDIVHTHAAKAGVLGRLAAYYSPHRPKVILHTYHGNVFDGYFSPLKTKVILAIERHLCKLSDGIIAISQAQKEDLVERYKIAPANKIHVIKLGFDLEKFKTQKQEKRISFREHYQISEETVVVSIIGRLAPIKNHLLFIKVIIHLKKNYVCPPMKFFIVGDGELFRDILKQIEDSGLSYCLPEEKKFAADIIFTSWRKDIDVINAGSDVVVLTSLNEGTPVSIIEAMASGKAVVSTDVGGVKDVFEDGYSGMLAKNNEEDFSDKLYQLISNKELRNSLGYNSEKVIFQKYSYSRLIDDTTQLYAKLIHGK
jgi:glycosyltransferase involved in cell wall biosynthesis